SVIMNLVEWGSASPISATPKFMISMSMIQVHSIASIVAVFIALITIVNALMTPKQAVRASSRPQF
ncbi:MAG: hypothetical protein AAF585_10135, partial [Verrucomicrobiota bacterium]